MRKLIFVMLLAFMGVSAAQADGTSKRIYVAVPVTRDCEGDLCNTYKRTRPHGLVPPQTELVCIPLKQAHPNIVVIRFYDADGRELDAGNRQHSNLKQEVDQFCVGRHYLVKAQAGHVEVCNDVDTKSLGPNEIAILLEQGMPANHWLYLFAGRTR